MPKAPPEPLTLDEARDSLPFFPVGTVVKIEGYVGVLEADASLTGPFPDFAKGYRPVACRIEAVRLVGCERDYREGDAASSREVVYPAGWEYLVVGPTGSKWGWVTEAELLAKGYRPPLTCYDRLEQACTAVVEALRGPLPVEPMNILALLSAVTDPIEQLRAAAGYEPTYQAQERNARQTALDMLRGSSKAGVS